MSTWPSIGDSAGKLSEAVGWFDDLGGTAGLLAVLRRQIVSEAIVAVTEPMGGAGFPKENDDTGQKS